ASTATTLRPATACIGSSAPSAPLYASTPRRPPGPTLFPYTTLFRSSRSIAAATASPSAPSRIRSSSSVRRIDGPPAPYAPLCCRSEEHTSELQSRENLVCRLLLAKKKPHRSG